MLRREEPTYAGVAWPHGLQEVEVVELRQAVEVIEAVNAQCDALGAPLGTAGGGRATERRRARSIACRLFDESEQPPRVAARPGACDRSGALATHGLAVPCQLVVDEPANALLLELRDIYRIGWRRSMLLVDQADVVLVRRMPADPYLLLRRC